MTRRFSKMTLFSPHADQIRSSINLAILQKIPIKMAQIIEEPSRNETRWGTMSTRVIHLDAAIFGFTCKTLRAPSHPEGCIEIS